MGNVLRARRSLTCRGKNAAQNVELCLIDWKVAAGSFAASPRMHRCRVARVQAVPRASDGVFRRAFTQRCGGRATETVSPAVDLQ